MTSNVGSRQLKEFGSGIGFNTASETKEQAHGVISKALNKAFSPEFLNRVDDIIMFDQLDKDAIFRIIDIELRDFYSRTENSDTGFELSGKKPKISSPTRDTIKFRRETSQTEYPEIP